MWKKDSLLENNVIDDSRFCVSVRCEHHPVVACISTHGASSCSVGTKIISKAG